MKNTLFFLQFPLFVATNLLVLITILELSGTDFNPDKYSKDVPVYNGMEEFDPLLSRLNSVRTLEKYCDSLFSARKQGQPHLKFEEAYPEIVVSTVRRRFYHGYSSFGISNNYSALIFEPLTGTKASAIVIPDEILKYSYAACSQQSIVVMNLLKNKGFLCRVLSFSGKQYGHFSFETYYNGSWHFYDPNMEPSQKVLDQYGRPSISFLAANQNILVEAYKHLPKSMVLDIFTNYSISEPNVVIAPRATLYQKVTQFLSYTLWIFFLITFIMVRKKYLQLSNKPYVRHSRVYFPQLQPGVTSSTYSKYSTQGA